MVRNSPTLSTTNFWFLKVSKFLQCSYHVYIVFHFLGYRNEMASHWYQLLKAFCEEFLFFCNLEKMNDFKHAFGTSSWFKNSGSIASIWTHQLVVFKNSVFFTMYFSFLIHSFLVCPHLILFFTYLYMCVFILESHYFRKLIAASQLKKATCC